MIEELRAEADSLGIEYDGRWGEKKLAAAIAESKMALEAEPEEGSPGESTPDKVNRDESERAVPIDIYLKGKDYPVKITRMLKDMFGGKRSRPLYAWKIAVDDVLSRRS